MFLTRDELIELTGYHTRPKCLSWLTVNGYRYHVASDGWPRVLRSAVVERLGGKQEAPEPQLRFG